MPGGVVTANEIHGSKLQGYYEGAIATAGTAVPYAGPSAPVNAIWTVKKATIATTPTLTFDWAGAASGNVTVFSTVNNETYRITWVYPGG